MADWALYLDESGTTDPHNLPLRQGQNPLFSLAGVALPLGRWREYDRRYLYLKREFFAAEIERSSKIDAVWEVKGADLVSPRNSGSERNAAFVHRVLDLIDELGGRVVGVTVLKGVASPTPKTTIYTKALQIIAERYAEFLKERDSSGVMILDSRMAHLKKGNGLDYTVGLQIADIVSALTYSNAYREKLAPNGPELALGYVDYRHTRRYWQRFRQLVFESQALHAGHRMFGLRTLDHRDQKPPQAQLAALADRFKR